MNASWLTITDGWLDWSSNLMTTNPILDFLKNWDWTQNFKVDVPNYVHVMSFGELESSPWRQSSGSTTGAYNQILIGIIFKIKDSVIVISGVRGWLSSICTCIQLNTWIKRIIIIINALLFNESECFNFETFRRVPNPIIIKTSTPLSI